MGLQLKISLKMKKDWLSIEKKYNKTWENKTVSQINSD